MKATFTYATVYDITATCASPLRTGNTENDTESILRTEDGRPFIQGTSLCGALREWVGRNKGAAMADRLFGSQSQAGCLILTDGLFGADTLQEERPHVRIDARTGAMWKKCKYDTVHLAKGSRFAFTVTLLTQAEPKDEAAVLEAALAAMNAGQIVLGAKKSTGYGRVSLAVKKACLDMGKPEARAAWLSGNITGEAYPLPTAIPTDKTVITVKGRIPALLVKSAYSEERKQEGRTSRTVAVNLKEGRDRSPVLPGSSIKGAVRKQAEEIAARLGVRDTLITAIFGNIADPKAEPKAARAVFSDAKLENTKSKETHRIRIDRFTGGVMPKALINEEPLGTDVTFTVTLPKADKAACGLLLYALRDLAAGLYSLGSGASIGRGRLTKAVITAGSMKLEFDEKGACTFTDPDKLADSWVQAMEGYKHAD